MHGSLKEMPIATRRMSSLPSFYGRAASSPILCSSKLLHPKMVGQTKRLLNYIVDGRCSSVLEDLDEDISYEALVAKLKQRYDT